MLRKTNTSLASFEARASGSLDSTLLIADLVEHMRQGVGAGAPVAVSLASKGWFPDDG